MARQNKRKAEAGESSEQPRAKAAKDKEPVEKRETETDRERETETEAAEEKTASQLFFERLQEVMQRVGAVGYVAEAGEDDDDDDEDEGCDLAELLMGNEDEDDEEDNEEEEGDAEAANAEGEPDAEAAADNDNDNEEDNEEDSDEDDDEDDEDEDDIVLGDGREYTEEEIAELRFVLLTEARTEAIEKMSALLVGEDEDDVNFNTAFSQKLFSAVPKEVKKILKSKKDGEKFDQLYALTKVLADFNTWVNDYEDEKALAAMLKELGAAWKTLLAKSDKDLDIDPEFTRAGVQKMLEKFAEMVALNEQNPAFEWK